MQFSRTHLILPDLKIVVSTFFSDILHQSSLNNRERNQSIVLYISGSSGLLLTEFMDVHRMMDAESLSV